QLGLGDADQVRVNAYGGDRRGRRVGKIRTRCLPAQAADPPPGVGSFQRGQVDPPHRPIQRAQPCLPLYGPRRPTRPPGHRAADRACAARPPPWPARGGPSSPCRRPASDVATSASPDPPADQAVPVRSAAPDCPSATAWPAPLLTSTATPSTLPRRSGH